MHDMMANWGMKVQLHSFLPRHQMEVHGKSHSPDTLPPGKEPLVPTEQGEKLASELVWTLEKNLLPLSGPTHSLVTILTTLFWIPLVFILIY